MCAGINGTIFFSTSTGSIAFLKNMVILCMVSLLNALLGSTRRTSSFQFSMKPLFVTGRDISRDDMFT